MNSRRLTRVDPSEADSATLAAYPPAADLPHKTTRQCPTGDGERPVENRGLIVIAVTMVISVVPSDDSALTCIVFGLETTVPHLQTSAEGIGWISGFLNGSSSTWPSNADAARPFSYDHRLA